MGCLSVSFFKLKSLPCICVLLILSSCDVTRETASPNELPQNFLETSPTCDGDCLRDRQALVNAQVTFRVDEQAANGAALGRAVGCSITALLGDRGLCIARAGITVANNGSRPKVGQQAAKANRTRLFRQETQASIEDASIRVERAKQALQSMSVRRSASLPVNRKLTTDDVRGYHTDLLLASVTLRNLQSAADELARLVNASKSTTKGVDFDFLRNPSTQFSLGVYAFKQEFAIQEKVFSDAVEAGGYNTGAAVENGSASTFVSMPRC